VVLLPLHDLLPGVEQWQADVHEERGNRHRRNAGGGRGGRHSLLVGATRRGETHTQPQTATMAMPRARHPPGRSHRPLDCQRRARFSKTALWGASNNFAGLPHNAHPAPTSRRSQA